MTATATATESATESVTVSATITEKPTVVRTIATKTRTRTVTYTPPPKPAISDGTYKVGTDIRSGEWRTNGGGEDGLGCYWEQDKDLSGSIYSVINNDNITGSAIVQLYDGQYFKISGGCDWRRT